MKHILLGAALVSTGLIAGALTSSTNIGSMQAQFGVSQQLVDTLWNLQKFVKQGCFIHASNERVRISNMEKASVVDEKSRPRNSNWE